MVHLLPTFCSQALHRVEMSTTNMCDNGQFKVVVVERSQLRIVEGENVRVAARRGADPRLAP